MGTIGHKSENVDMADLFCWGQFLRLSRTYLFMFWLQADVFMAIDIFCQLNVSGMSNLCDIFVKQGRHFVRSTVLIVLGTILSGLKFNFKYSNYNDWWWYPNKRRWFFLRMNGGFFARWVWNAIIDRQNKTLFIHFAIFLKNIVLQEAAKYWA